MSAKMNSKDGRAVDEWVSIVVADEKKQSEIEIPAGNEEQTREDSTAAAAAAALAAKKMRKVVAKVNRPKEKSLVNTDDIGDAIETTCMPPKTSRSVKQTTSQDQGTNIDEPKKRKQKKVKKKETVNDEASPQKATRKKTKKVAKSVSDCEAKQLSDDRKATDALTTGTGVDSFVAKGKKSSAPKSPKENKKLTGGRSEATMAASPASDRIGENSEKESSSTPIIPTKRKKSAAAKASMATFAEKVDTGGETPSVQKGRSKSNRPADSKAGKTPLKKAGTTADSAREAEPVTNSSKKSKRSADRTAMQSPLRAQAGTSIDDKGRTLSSAPKGSKKTKTRSHERKAIEPHSAAKAATEEDGKKAASLPKRSKKSRKSRRGKLPEPSEDLNVPTTVSPHVAVMLPERHETALPQQEEQEKQKCGLLPSSEAQQDLISYKQQQVPPNVEEDDPSTADVVPGAVSYTYEPEEPSTQLESNLHHDSFSNSYSSSKSGTMPNAVVVDEEALRREILDNTEFVHAENIDEEKDGQLSSQQKARLLMTCLIVGVVVMMGAVFAYLGTRRTKSAGTPNVNIPYVVPSTAPTSSMVPSGSPTISPTTLSWSEADIILPLMDHQCLPGNAMGTSGMFGSDVSMSDDGSRVAVAYGEYQEYFFRRKLGFVSNSRLLELFDCSGEKCVQLEYVEEGYDGLSSVTVDISGDGSKMAVAYTSTSESGEARNPSLAVYSISDDSMMLTIGGFPLDSGINRTVALSHSGDVIALLDSKNSGNLTTYQYIDANFDWQQLGSTIHPQSGELQKAMSLSASGQVVAIGADTISDAWNALLFCSEGLYFVGYSIRVYRYNVNDWEKVGFDIVGAKNESLVSDRSISLSSDGRAIAVGASARDSCNIGYMSRIDYGHVKILRLSDKGSWELLGNVIYGEQGSAFGHSVSLNSDGTTVAIGESSSNVNGVNSGKATIYKYDSTTDKWTKVGQDLIGPSGSSFGHAVALSAKGDKVAIGAPFDSTRGENTGAVRFFHSIGV